jgi:uncharacterized protein (DUF58 family)
MNGYWRAAENDREAPLLDTAFLTRLEKLMLEWRDCFAGPAGGLQNTRYRGSGQEFFEHRHFHAGDDLRAVNWRAYMRFERLFLKTFQLEPRVPIRVLLDASASMAAGCAPGEPTKFDWARRLSAALIYIGLVQLDGVLLQPFSDRLLRPEMASGGRYRFATVEKQLRLLIASGKTNFLAVVREFLGRYPQPGLAIVISDFLDDSGALRPLQYVADSGHELMLVQIWSEEDREPAAGGELELIDSESGAILKTALDENAREAYTKAFDEHAGEVKKVATRNGGRYTALSTRMRLEEALFGPLALRQKV